MDDHKNKKENADDATKHDSLGYADDTKFTSPDKYLEIEQPGVTYTDEGHPESNSDNFHGSNHESSGKWKADGNNSLNSNAFNQDDAILKDNIDLDEDQSRSISSNLDLDTNTTDEI